LSAGFSEKIDRILISRLAELRITLSLIVEMSKTMLQWLRKVFEKTG